MWWESDTLPCYYYLDRQLCSTTLPMGESPIQFQLKTTYIVDATLQVALSRDPGKIGNGTGF